MLSFDAFCKQKLTEDIAAGGDGAPVNSTTNIDQVQQPLALVRRKQLPQIKDHSKFMSDLNEQGISVVEESQPQNQYKPTQNELDPEKIKKMKSYGDMKPIIVSKDNYIVDGHHRWAAQDNVKALRINMNHSDLMYMLKNKPYITHEAI